MMKTKVNGRRVYLSGPMTGLPDCNRAAFVMAHAKLREMRALDVYDPAIVFIDWPTHPHEMRMKHCLNRLTAEEDQHRSNKELDNSILRFEKDRINLLVSLPGWQDSEGASLERKVAEACGIECVDWMEVLHDGE